MTKSDDLGRILVLVYMLLCFLFLTGCDTSSQQKEVPQESHYVTIKYREDPVDISTFETLNTSKSSFVRGVRYDKGNQYMVIDLNGVKYHYCRFPASVWNEFKLAQSFGSYYDSRIKGNYDCREGGVPSYDYQSYIDKAIKQFGLQDFTGAIIYINKAIFMDPSKSLAYSIRALMISQYHFYEDAIKDVNIAMELGYSESAAYGFRGSLKQQLKDYEGAIKDYDIAIILDPKNFVSYYSRGSVKILIGEVDDGCIDLHKSLILGALDIAGMIQEYCTL